MWDPCCAHCVLSGLRLRLSQSRSFASRNGCTIGCIPCNWLHFVRWTVLAEHVCVLYPGAFQPPTQSNFNSGTPGCMRGPKTVNSYCMLFRGWAAAMERNDTATARVESCQARRCQAAMHAPGVAEALLLAVQMCQPYLSPLARCGIFSSPCCAWAWQLAGRGREWLQVWIACGVRPTGRGKEACAQHMPSEGLCLWRLCGGALHRAACWALLPWALGLVDCFQKPPVVVLLLRGGCACSQHVCR